MMTYALSIGEYRLLYGDHTRDELRVELRNVVKVRHDEIKKLPDDNDPAFDDFDHAVWATVMENLDHRIVALRQLIAEAE